jgi:hypothetical protein
MNVNYVDEPSYDHEVLVQEMIEFSLGAPGVFRPLVPVDAHTGRKICQLADLAWILRDTVILFFMSTGRGARRHNILQAHDAVRCWRGGLELRGDNGFRAFSIPCPSVSRIIVASIVPPDARAEFLRSEAERMKVSMCVNIPQDVIQFGARAGMGGLDFVRFFSSFDLFPHHVASGFLKNLVRHLVADAHMSAMSFILGYPTDVLSIDGDFQIASRSLFGLQLPVGKRNLHPRSFAGNPQLLTEPLEVISELELDERLRIATELAIGRRVVKTNPIAVLRVVRLRLYSAALFILPNISQEQQHLVKERLQRLLEFSNSLHRRGMFLIVHDVSAGVSLVAIPKKSALSAIAGIPDPTSRLGVSKVATIRAAIANVMHRNPDVE